MSSAQSQAGSEAHGGGIAESGFGVVGWVVVGLVAVVGVILFLRRKK
jgi:hypothetical protein